jgi:Trp operon repressor
MKPAKQPRPKVVNAWPRKKRLAARLVIVWDLMTYYSTKAELAASLADALEEISGIASPPATDIRENIYLQPKIPFKPRQKGDRPEYIKGHPERPTSDPTPARAEQLRRYKEAFFTAAEYRNTMRRINAIETVMAKYQTREDFKAVYQVVKMKYFDQSHSDQEIAKELNISVRTLYRYQDRAIKDIAKILGFVV